MPNTQRLFFALSLPTNIGEQLRHDLEKNKKNILTLAEKTKFIPPENFHITLAFLGKVNTSLIGTLIDATTVFLHEFKPQTISLSSAHIFHTSRSHSIFALKAEPLLFFSALAKHCQSAANHIEINDYSHSQFRPHLTLARLKNIKKNQPMNFSGFDTLYFLADSFSLFSSEQTATGSVYHRQYTFRLSN